MGLSAPLSPPPPLNSPQDDPSGRLPSASPLVRFHKILIAAGIVFFLLYAFLELRHYGQSGQAAILVRSGVSAAAACALWLYLRWFLGSLRP